MVLPDPGGPTMSSPWRPAAATVIARLASSWSATSPKSGVSRRPLPRPASWPTSGSRDAGPSLSSESRLMPRTPLRPAADERACRRDHQTKPVRAGRAARRPCRRGPDRPTRRARARQRRAARGATSGGSCAGGDEDGDGDRQVIGRPRLPQLARGQVDRDVLPGQPKAARLEGAAHPRPRLEDRRVRHPHDVEPPAARSRGSPPPPRRPARPRAATPRARPRTPPPSLISPEGVLDVVQVGGAVVVHRD